MQTITLRKLNYLFIIITLTDLTTYTQAYRNMFTTTHLSMLNDSL